MDDRPNTIDQRQQQKQTADDTEQAKRLISESDFKDRNQKPDAVFYDLQFRGPDSFFVRDRNFLDFDVAIQNCANTHRGREMQAVR